MSDRKNAYRITKADKQLQDKLQALLSHLLREEDNKYCADCDAKGPRWASWNLGIFVCIRCAGIHRNLGVHISRVKSVNLDSWTDEQVGSVQNMGNSKGRAVYEANLPDGFRRPQNDSALETFIRAKYEHKKYIAREWVPPKNVQKADFSVLGGPTPASKPSDKKIELNPKSTLVPRPNSSGNLKDITSPTTAAAQQQSSDTTSSPSDDLFADFISAPPVAPATTATVTGSSSEEQDFFNQVSSGTTTTTTGASTTGAKIDKESILSLYAKAPPVQTTMQLSGQNPLLIGGSAVNAQMQNNPFLVGGMVAPQTQAAAFHGLGGFTLGQQQQQQPAFGMVQPNASFPVNSFQQAGVPQQNPGLAFGGSMNLMNAQLSNLQLNPRAQKQQTTSNGNTNGTLPSTNLWN